MAYGAITAIHTLRFCNDGIRCNNSYTLSASVMMVYGAVTGIHSQLHTTTRPILSTSVTMAYSATSTTGQNYRYTQSARVWRLHSRLLNNSSMIPAVTLFITPSAARQDPLVYIVVKITCPILSSLQTQVVKDV